MVDSKGGVIHSGQRHYTRSCAGTLPRPPRISSEGSVYRDPKLNALTDRYLRSVSPVIPQ